MSELNELYRQIMACTRCVLHQGRNRAVPGEGPEDAQIMFIGEAPGFHEDRQGRPFVGAAGQFLEELLGMIGLKREEVYIANVVKCFISPRVLIYTAEGYKPIKDIHPGDLVLTHKGRFRRVVYVRPHEILSAGSEVVRFTVRAHSDENARPTRITVTPEHPFLVNGEWKPARELQIGDRLRALGDRCEVCGQTFFVRGEYVFVEAVVTEIEHRHTRRNFPLYNIGVEEDESYVAAGLVSHNCRPPANRDPLPEEIEACRPHLDRQIELICPKVIVTLGRFSMARWFPEARISRIHGQPRKIGGVLYYPMYHPAAALHQPSLRRFVEEDIRRIPELLAQAERIRDEGSPPPEAQQLSLF